MAQIIGPELDGLQVENFISEGYLHLPSAFSPDLAARCVDALWDVLARTTRVDRRDPATWTEPLIRVPSAGVTPLAEAISAPAVMSAIGALVGRDRWQRGQPGQGFGGLPVRFPSEVHPGETGWHVDGGFDPPHYRVNLASRGRALLVLMLFSDVTPEDAPTHLAVGSHAVVARLLRRAGDEGRTGLALHQDIDARSWPVAEVTGAAGDVYLCHPFLAHSASWPHRGSSPRFIGHPCMNHVDGPGAGGYDYDRLDGDHSPVERAVRRSINRSSAP